jgi:YebC/PmpR family DNA-binding regulatory protein
MAGHSAYSNIKHRKDRQDAKRGKIWTKISKSIIVAAQLGGGDPDANFRLRFAVQEARAASMPKETIERAIKKGTGELEGGKMEEALYEGYGPAGVAILCDIVTDNRNRTAAEVRKIFEVHGGKLGATNCVAWMFERKGLFRIAKSATTEERLMEVALEAGADDIQTEGESFVVSCPADSFHAVSEALADAKIEPESKEYARVPSNTVELTDPETAKTVLKLMDALDEHEDVQLVAANFVLPEEVMAAVSG